MLRRLFPLLLLLGCIASLRASDTPLPAGSRPELVDGLYAEFTTPRGVFVTELHYKQVPATVAGFVGLAEGTLSPRDGKPFYTGLTWYRVVPGFVLQSGNPGLKDTGDDIIPHRFADEFVPGLRHKDVGILSMANAGPDTNGCEFFVTLGDCTRLNYLHTVFGRTIRGLEVLPLIQPDDAFTIKILRIGAEARAFKADPAAFAALTAKLKPYAGSPDPGPTAHFDDPSSLIPVEPPRAKNFNYKLANFERATGVRIVARLLAKSPTAAEDAAPGAYMRALAEKFGVAKRGALAVYFADEKDWRVWFSDEAVNIFLGRPAASADLVPEGAVHQVKTTFIDTAIAEGDAAYARQQKAAAPDKQPPPAQHLKLQVDALLDALILKLDPQVESHTPLPSLLPAAGSALSAPDDVKSLVAQKIDADYASLEALYKHFHANPELSLMEEKTAARLAAELRAAGYEVTEKFGGTGIVGVLKNGAGPTLLIRTDLDGLPVTEETGLPYASTTRVTSLSGTEVSTMHACGHDVHMTVFTGTARLLAALKDRWSGTAVFIGQPAEEIGTGARSMLAAGLYRQFPTPDYAIAIHDSATLPAGTVGIREGFVMANVDSVDITVRGRGGHGAYPHVTIDPVVLAARIVVALQTIVSRETRPVEPAVVTVGSIHGGTKHNIIPDEVKLQLTLRSYSDQVREHTIAALRRICRGEAIAAGVPEELMPLIAIKDEFTPATYNDPTLTRRVRTSLETWLGADKVTTIDPEMGGEDFSQFARTVEKVPACMFRIGAVDPAKVAESQRTGGPLPSLHSSKFAPLPEPTLKTGVTALTAAALDLLAKK